MKNKKVVKIVLLLVSLVVIGFAIQLLCMSLLKNQQAYEFLMQHLNVSYNYAYEIIFSLMFVSLICAVLIGLIGFFNIKNPKLKVLKWIALYYAVFPTIGIIVRIIYMIVWYFTGL